MKHLPKEISAAYAQVKREYPFNVTLRRINGRYYVYRDRGLWIKETHKRKLKSEYLGRITGQGEYVKKKAPGTLDIDRASELIAEHGGEVVWHTKTEEEKKRSEIISSVQQEKPNLKDTDLKILMALSMNARMPISRMSKIVGLSEQTVYSRIKYLEDKLGIKYILEVDIEKLGYTPYILLIKFDGQAPTAEELKELMKGEDRIQFAVMTKGEYDVIMYFVDEGALKAQDDLLKFRLKDAWGKYRAYITLTEFATTYHYMPIKESFIENILKERIWHRSKEAQKPKDNQIRHREFLLIKELNSNSAIGFTAIDEMHSFTEGASRYLYNELHKKGIIIRSTISLSRLPVKYIGVIWIIDIDFKSIKENRYRLLLDEIQYGDIVNRYSVFGNIGGQVGSIVFLPLFEDGELNKIAYGINEELPGNVIKTLVVTDVLTGELCYRRFDNTYSRAYRLLVGLKKIEPVKLIPYE